MHIGKTIIHKPISSPEQKKLHEAVLKDIQFSSQNDKPDFTPEQLEASANITITTHGVDIEDSLLKELFPDTYLTMGKPQNITDVQRSYIDHAGKKLDESNDDVKQLESIAQSLVFNSANAHEKVKDIFKSFGALTKDTESLLVKSETYVFNEIDDLLNTHAERFKAGIKPLPGFMAPNFTFEVTTQEGDKVELSFDYSGNGFLVSQQGVNLSMNVEGEISDQEQLALQNLYEEVAEYISQNFTTDTQSFDLTAIDLSKFDNQVLSSFDIETEFSTGVSTLSYSVDHLKGEQRLAASMDFMFEFLNYDLDITTALSGGDKGKEGVLHSLVETLDKMDTGLSMDNQINSFVVDSFASMLNTKAPVKTREDGLTIDLFNNSMKVMETKIEGLNLKQVNTVADYQFSFDMYQMGRTAEHTSRIDMAQKTDMWVDGLGKHIKQKQSLDVNMSKFGNDETTEWILSKEQEIRARLNHQDQLKHHKVTGKHDEEVIKTWTDEDHIIQITRDKINKTYLQQLDVLESTAKLVTEEHDKYFQGAYEKLEQDGPKRTKGESRYEREYRQVLNYKRYD